MHHLPDNPTLEYVFDFKEKRTLNVSDVLCGNEKSLFELRGALASDENRGVWHYLCPECCQGLVLRTRLRQVVGSHVFFFQHHHKSRPCAFKVATPGRDIINAIKYHGIREGAEHKRVKNSLARILERSQEFSDIRLEEPIAVTIDGKREWKKPDVTASYKGMPVVFEIQLSTTFLDVILRREAFYNALRIPIFWVFSDFDPEAARAAQKDIFYSNHQNVFSLDAQALALSHKMGSLIFTGHYQVPTATDDEMVLHEWQNRPVNIASIVYDCRTAKPYFYDYEQALALSRAEVTAAREDDEAIERAISQHIERDLASLKQAVIAMVRYDTNGSAEPRLDRLVESIQQLGCLREESLTVSDLKFLAVFYSLQDGTVYIRNQAGRWRYLINYVWDHHRRYWLVVMSLAKIYGRLSDLLPPLHDEQIVDDDDLVTRRRKLFKQGFENPRRYPEMSQSFAHYGLFQLIEPALTEPLESVMERVKSTLIKA